MFKKYFFTTSLFFSFIFQAFGQQPKILHFTKTSGYDHNTRSQSFLMFQQISAEANIAADNDNTGEAFTHPGNLEQYKAVVFSNTSGNNLLDSAQRSHFEQYMAAGGSLLGIHAASDTYRHSSANGNNTGTWDFYAETLGASVQENPNHVTGTPVYRIDAMIAHPILSGIPTEWNKAEEYYYWENGYFDTGNIVLQKVEETIGPNGMVNVYDSARAVTWFRETLSGGKIFYTSLGHDVSNYTSDTLFYRLIKNAIVWMMNDSPTTVLQNFREEELLVFPNPANDFLHISQKHSEAFYELKIYDMAGLLLHVHKFEAGENEIDIRDFSSGIFFAEIRGEGKVKRFRFVKN